MEFQNETLRIPAKIEPHVRSLLTPGSGSTRALATILEELADLIDPTRPPRWLMLQEGDEMELLVHLAPPMFTAQGHDADEYMDEADDEFAYMDFHGDAYLRSRGKEYDLDDPDIREVEAYLCADHDLLADFVWFDEPPDPVVFGLIMDDAAAAYRGGLDAYVTA